MINKAWTKNFTIPPPKLLLILYDEFPSSKLQNWNFQVKKETGLRYPTWPALINELVFD
jgi:hypothetical protein